MTNANSNTYSYDPNGNQTTRYIGADTYNLLYDAENRLVEVTKNGASIAQFVYDGDGKRVKSVVNGETTLFVGNYYEQSGGTVTKYYYAGSTRIALRTGGTLYYLLGDHLGSTTLTTDASGNVISELHYAPWGETRYNSGTTPTRYQYTGQYSYAAEFGLYFYNARWYDPALSRFAQPDTLIPEQSQGVQAWDRYAYVNNNPLKYTDPSGHMRVEDPGSKKGCSDPKYCENGKPKTYSNPQTRPTGSSQAGSGTSSTSTPQGRRLVRATEIGLAGALSTTGAPPSFIENYCGASSYLACGAMLAQDVATLIDLEGVGLIEMPAVAMGCLDGGTLGCAIAEVGVIATWNTTLNMPETIASSLSLGLTISDDILNNGGWGENSSTSLATWALGFMPLTPSWDLAVDIYASGYNHSFFNGVNTIWTNGLFR